MTDTATATWTHFGSVAQRRPFHVSPEAHTVAEAIRMHRDGGLPVVVLVIEPDDYAPPRYVLAMPATEKDPKFMHVTGTVLDVIDPAKSRCEFAGDPVYGHGDKPCTQECVDHENELAAASDFDPDASYDPTGCRRPAPTFKATHYALVDGVVIPVWEFVD